MPMTLNIGLSRKVGEPNYGSRGASASFAVEVEASLLREPERLREKIEYLFAEARLAVDQQLGRGRRDANGEHDKAGRQSGGGDGVHYARIVRGATCAQVRAIYAIASQQGVDLPARLAEEFNVSRAEELSVADASALIDWLKAGEAGEAGDGPEASEAGEVSGEGGRS